MEYTQSLDSAIRTDRLREQFSDHFLFLQEPAYRIQLNI
jgi:hypothetical protein